MREETTRAFFGIDVDREPEPQRSAGYAWRMQRMPSSALG
jgi:hypothetical protein